MSDDFDPYLAWLGIDAAQRPPSHYQLLGIAETEADAARIQAAADLRMAEIRSYQMGPRGRFTQKLLNELAAAKLCLLDAAARRAYDEALARQRTSATSHFVAWVAPAPPLAEPPPASPPVAAPSERVAAPLPVVKDDPQEPVPENERAWLFAAALLFLVVIGVVGASNYFLLPRLQVQVTPAPTAPPVPKPKPDPSPIEEELFVLQEGSGDLNFPSSVAELSGGLTRIDDQGKSLVTGWKDETTVARWKFKVVRPAVFQIRIEYAAAAAGSGQWELRLGEESKSRDMASSSVPGEIVADEFFWSVPRGGEHLLELSAQGLPEGSNLTLHSLRFVYQRGQRP